MTLRYNQSDLKLPCHEYRANNSFQHARFSLAKDLLRLAAVRLHHGERAACSAQLAVALCCDYISNIS